MSFSFLLATLEKSVYQSVTQVGSDDFTRLLPWTFYRLFFPPINSLIALNLHVFVDSLGLSFVCPSGT